MSASTSAVRGDVQTFTLLRSAPIPSLNLEYQEYRHEPTGARHIHLAAPDKNNVFMVAFKTVPEDSTGVAHILEHTALCGSNKFPVRDPFFMMLRRSLNTFMNAFTGSDMTAYPFASQNPKDFDNLLEVYLDCAFFPRLEALDFAQEGHRIEPVDADDPDSELAFKGVVYNEMKGAMSSPVLRLWQALQSALFPTTTYHFNSGGEPSCIPDLTYEQLRAFHARHYHPSNATLLTYGSFDHRAHQARFEQWALSRFEAAQLDIDIPGEQRLTEPRQLQIAYPADAEEGTEGRSQVVLGWLLGPTFDRDAIMTARLIESVLLEDGASPLRRALETTPLGSAPSELCGLDDSLREAVFVCGLEGTDPDKADAVESLILETLREVAEQGVPTGQVEAALHQMELAQREVGNRMPYGLQLMQRVLPAVIHGGDPLAELDIDPVLARLREAIRDPDFVASKVRELLCDNPHRVRVTMVPDTDLAAREQAAEAERLAAYGEGLDAAARRALAERAQALQARQNAEDDPGLLPRVTVADVPADIEIPAGEPREVAGMPGAWYACGTNGLVHEQVIVELPALAEAEVDTLALFWSLYCDLGCGEQDYLAMQARQTRTGSFGASASVRGLVDDVQGVRGFFVLEGHGLTRDAGAIAALLRDLLAGVRFDEPGRLRELVAQERADAEADLTARGHSLAGRAAAAGTGAAAALAHRWDGLAGIRALKALDRELREPAALETFSARLRAIHDKLLHAPRRLLLVGEPEQSASVVAAVEAAWREQPPAAPTGAPAFTAPAADARVAQAWTTNTSVNFCARAYPAVPAAHGDAPVLHVLGHLLRDGYLHRAIREQGGAYGAGAAYEGDSGSFRFFSYRDPRLGETLADFDRSLEWLHEHQDPQRVEEAILGTIQDLDHPRSPAGEAIAAHFGELQGRDAGFRREYRRRVLDVGLEDLRRVAESYLTPARASTAVLTSRDRLAREPDVELTIEPV